MRLALVVAVAAMGSPASVGAAATHGPTLVVTLATPAVGNLGGPVTIDALVSGASSCTIASTRAWEGKGFSETAGCAGTSRVVGDEVTVPANTDPVPFRAGIQFTASGPGGTTTERVAVAVAAGPTYPTTGAQTFQFDPGTQPTSNWSGYVLETTAPSSGAGSFLGVTGEWKAPVLRCDVTPSALSSIWVGVDGVRTPDAAIFQAGIEPACSGRDASDRAWWTDEAHGYLPQDLFNVTPGDVVRAEVEKISNDVWQYDVDDLTSGQQRTADEPYSGPGLSAEWVVEAPGTDPTPIVDFGQVAFSHLGLVLSGRSWGDPPGADAKHSATPAGTVETSTGPFLGSGPAANFTVSYRSVRQAAYGAVRRRRSLASSGRL